MLKQYPVAEAIGTSGKHVGITAVREPLRALGVAAIKITDTTPFNIL